MTESNQDKLVENEATSVQLHNSNSYDVFVKYNNDTICLHSRQTTQKLDLSKINLTELPTGVRYRKVK